MRLFFKQRPGHFVACLVMAAIFLFSVAVQYNDPDRLLWISIYAVGLVLTIMHLCSKVSFVWLLATSLLGIVGVVYLSLSIRDVEFEKVFLSLNMQGCGVEEVREAGGVLLQSLWLAYLAYVNRNNIPSSG